MAAALPGVRGSRFESKLADSGLLAEVQARHGHSAQPESLAVCAVLQAVLDVVAAEGLEPTPTAIFAGIMSALERPNALESPEARGAAALCSRRRCHCRLPLPCRAVQLTPTS